MIPKSTGIATPQVTENASGAKTRVTSVSPSASVRSNPSSTSQNSVRRNTSPMTSPAISCRRLTMQAANRALRMASNTLVGARLKSGGPRIAIDRAGALGRRRVDGKVEKERHLVHAVEQHDPATCQVELAGVLGDG